MKNIIFYIIFVILTFNTSCLKKQNLDADDLGPAIAPIEITKALGTGFGAFDLNDIKANEFNSYVLTQKVQDSYIETLEQQDLTIESSVNTIDKLSLDLVLAKIKYSGGQSSQSTRKWHKDCLKSEGKAACVSSSQANTMADNDEPTFMFLVFQSLAFGSCVAEGKYPETCHQLIVRDFKYKVPQSAAAQHQCADADNCYINARKVEFDMIRNYLLDKDGKPKRTHYTMIISKEVPFLSRVLQFCSRSLYEISNSQQKILADLCYNVNNYAFGN
jgi:hypothetical protein